MEELGPKNTGKTGNTYQCPQQYQKIMDSVCKPGIFTREATRIKKMEDLLKKLCGDGNDVNQKKLEELIGATDAAQVLNRGSSTGTTATTTGRSILKPSRNTIVEVGTYKNDIPEHIRPLVVEAIRSLPSDAQQKRPPDFWQQLNTAADTNGWKSKLPQWMKTAMDRVRTSTPQKPKQQASSSRGSGKV